MKRCLGLCVSALLLMLCSANVGAVERETDFIVDIDPQVMLVVPNEPVRLDFSPSQGGSFNSASFDVFASTNSKSGYTLTLQTAKTHLESTYADVDTGIAPRIPSMTYVDGGMTADAFSASNDDQNVLNHWGISIDNTTSFNSVGSSSIIKTTNNTASNEKTTINVAAKVNTDVPFGNYTTTINFIITPNIINAPRGVSGGSVDVASGGEGAGFEANTLGRSYEIYYSEVLQKSIYVKDNSTPEGYHELKDREDTTGKGLYFAMQDMNAAICDRVKTVPDQLQVMDLRDAKVYWIAKLADGKCWMTQNLDLDLSSNVAYTPADTDVRSNWTPSISTTDYDGKILGTNTVYEWYNNNSATNIPHSLDVGDWYWIGNWDDNGTSTWYSSYSTYYMQGQVGEPARFQFRTPFEGNGEHGHVGNYYSFAAAVAMNDVGALKSGVGIDQSICPAHWTLPNYADYSSDPENNYYKTLLTTYRSSSNNDQVATAEPLYFVRAGEIESNYFYNPGSYGYYWTNTPQGSSSVYAFYHNSGSAYAESNTIPKYYKVSIRCVAR